MPEVARFWESKESLQFNEGSKVMIEKLTIGGYMPQSFTPALSQLFDLSVVTRLFLFNCDTVMIRQLPVFQNLSFFHFSTPSGGMHSDNMSLEAFFKRNPDIEHLHLHMRYLATVPVMSLPLAGSSLPLQVTKSNVYYLWHLRDKLRTLSLYDAMCADNMAGDGINWCGFPSESSLKFICREFRNLQQLGTGASEQLLLDASDDDRRNELCFQSLVSRQPLNWPYPIY